MFVKSIDRNVPNKRTHQRTILFTVSLDNVSSVSPAFSKASSLGMKNVHVSLSKEESNLAAFKASQKRIKSLPSQTMSSIYIYELIENKKSVSRSINCV